jgi:hypothetical protein
MRDREGLDHHGLNHMQLVGKVKGTRPYPNNIFSGVMVTLTDCSFVNRPGP